MVNLSTTIGSLHLKNPTMLASGIMDEDAGSMQRMIDCDAGAIVTKSIGMQPREGYPNPTVLELEFGLLNAMGLPNPGVDEYGNEMKQLHKSKIPIIGSIYAANVPDFIALASKMKQYGAAAVELNVSCPHAKRYGLEVGCDTSLLQMIVSSIKKQVRIPVFVKVSPNVVNIVEIAMAAEKGTRAQAFALGTGKLSPLCGRTAG